MSYCRMGYGDSDVYMFPCETHIECMGCSINPPSSCLTTHTEAIEHLLEHRRRGDKAPEYAIERLKEEREKFGDVYDGRVLL